MKKLISKFSDKLLSNASLRAVKGAGVPYCFCNGSPVDCPPGETGGGNGCPTPYPAPGWKVPISKYYPGAKKCGDAGATNGYGPC